MGLGEGVRLSWRGMKRTLWLEDRELLGVGEVVTINGDERVVVVLAGEVMVDWLRGSDWREGILWLGTGAWLGG